MSRILLAMSGGVDSSAAADVLRAQGHEVVGAHMLLSGDTADDARETARALGIEFHVVDMREQFLAEVIEPFVRAYESGLTPNPCVLCNRRLKFGALLEVADGLGCEFLATGHYAKVGEYNGRKCIKIAADRAKDQSYVLYSLSPDVLSRIVFPLGDMTKGEVRKIAAGLGLQCAESPESQDICFIEGGDYAEFIERYRGRSLIPGEFLSAKGEVLGRHRGVAAYTVGQRRGLGLPMGDRVYVTGKDADRNIVTVGSEKELYKSSVYVGNVVFSAVDYPKTELEAEVMLRYNQKTRQPARIRPLGGGKVRLDFAEPQRAPAPGQSAVFYDGETVIGGGVILIDN